MSFKVSYSGLNSNQQGKSPWADAIPYVSVDSNSEWSASKLYKEESVSLNGQLTLSGFNALGSSPNTYGYSSSPIVGLSYPTGYIQVVRNAFSRSFGDLVVVNSEDEKILSGIYYVDSINFDSQNFIGVIDYSVQLKKYNDLAYSGINPTETVEISEEGNGVLNINHSISANGVGPAFNDASPNSFNSVKTFVQNLTGQSRIKSLVFNSGYIPTGSGASGVYFSGSDVNLILTSQTESINRLENSYGIQEVFKIDNLRPSEYATKRFSVDLNSGYTDDYVIVNVNCNIEGAKDKSFTGVSGLLENITDQMYSVATGMYGNATDLCSTPISFSVETTRPVTGHNDGTYMSGVTGVSTINVSCAFDNSLDGTFFDYNVSFSTDEVSNVTSLNIDGVIKGRGLHTSQKFYDASGYLFNTLLSNQPDLKTLLFNKAVSGFNSFAPTADTNGCFGIIGERGGNSFGFIKDKGQGSISLNTGVGEISLNASFSDEAAVSGYDNFSWNASVEVGVPLLVIKPSYLINGYNIVQEVGVNQQSSFTFNGDFSFQTGSQGGIPILSASTKPHTGILKKLVEAEGITVSDVSNATSGNIDVVLDGYNKKFDFVNGVSSTSTDYLSSGFDVNLKTNTQPLPVYATFKTK